MEPLDPDEITPADSPLTLTDVLGSPVYNELFTPTMGPGDPAFDFELARLDGEGTFACPITLGTSASC
jgi:hypothetical protein